MPIPDYQTLMLPLLRVLAAHGEQSKKELVEALAAEFKLTDGELKELLPSGQQPVFQNRVGWASTYMKQAGLIESPRRAVFKITERGNEVLSHNPPKINAAFLEQFPEFREFRQATRDRTRRGEHKTVSTREMEETPAELLESGYQRLREELAEELLEQVKRASPSFFERLVIDLLVKMGYGGSRQDAGRAIGRTGDEGIDGIISEDRLGLDVIYIQAKRWDNVVGRPEIQKFVGALQGQRARKGIFITTSKFTDEAIQYARGIESKVILIDGDRLTELMIDFDIGVSPVASYQIKKVDIDFFSEE